MKWPCSGRPVLVWLSVAAIPARAATAQWDVQSFNVTAEPDSGTVGDTVRLRFRVRLHERDLLTDSVPRPVGELPQGVRVLAVEQLHRRADRVFEGRAAVAFYRTGTREVPVFGLPFLRIVSGQRGLLRSEPARVEIVPLLEAGNPSLRDIRDLERAPGPSPLPFLILAVMTALFVLLRRGRGKPPPVPVAQPPEALVPPPSPFEIALARLSEIERSEWPARGEVARHYDAVIDTLPGYLESCDGVPARERTTSELLWTLPPHLTDDGLRRRCEALLDQADLVKFARRRPGADTGAAFLAEARTLLQRWHRAPRGEVTGAAG